MRELARGQRWRVGFGVGVATALCLALPSAGTGQSNSRAEALEVELLRTSQQRILSTGRLKVRVEASEPGAVRLLPRAVGATGQEKLGKARRVELDRGRKLGVRLSRAGRVTIARCEARELLVKARFRPAVDGPSARASASAPISLDSAACSRAGGTPGGGAGGGGGGSDGSGNDVPPPSPWTGPDFATGDFSRCDFMDPAVCLQPWPNDYFTAPDSASDTRRRLNLDLQSMPRNRAGKPIDNSEINRNDGFSPGSMLITRVPGLDNPQAFANTGAVPIWDPGAYDDPDQPVVVINAETGERHPVWAEIDFNPLDPKEGRSPDDPNRRADVNLIIRPLVNFEENTRYVVALRNLKDENGQTIAPSDAFRVYRDNLITDQPVVESRRPHMEELFGILGGAQIERSSLYLAWDFTVASERNLSERMLAIRDDAFADLGDADLDDLTVQGTSPSFTIESVGTGSGGTARVVDGTMTVPCYLNNGCAPAGGTFNYKPTDLAHPDRVPAQNGTTEVAFQCRIPDAALADGQAHPARPSLYGHGLLGSHTEVGAGNIRAMANEHNFIFCATDWAGFATVNIPNILAILQDLSLFPLLADHSQQGFLNFLYLGRLMLHEDGLVSDPAFQDGDGDPLIDRDKLFYDGNSQGGILGGGLTAVAPDFERAVLGVPGMNYSTLLRRSVDFEPYAKGQFGGPLEETICERADEIPEPTLAAEVEALCVLGVPDDTELGLYDNYPNELERPLILALIQTLWDRAEANGYAHHMTDDPLPNTPPHEALLHVAFGDHQVANVAAEVEARTIGAGVYQPALDPSDTDPQEVDPGPNQRHWERDGVNPLFGIPSITSFPYPGSALVYWDGGPLGFDDPFDGDSDNDGTATPPDENVPPRPPDYGADPHSYPRADVKARAQKSAFLSDPGTLRNPCTTTNNVLSPPLPIAFEMGTPIPCYANGYLGLAP